MSIYKKLLDVQKEVGTLKKGATNPFYNSKYIDINSVLETLTPILHKHNLLLLQPLASVEGKPAIRTILMDTDSGDSIDNTAVITEINDAQKMGGSVTYWRRYGVIAMFGLGAEDDDGNSLVKSAPKTATPKPKTTSAAPKAVRSNSF